jgi:hypothetical protein
MSRKYPSRGQEVVYVRIWADLPIRETPDSECKERRRGLGMCSLSMVVQFIFVALIRRAAEKGDAVAQLTLGVLYAEGL